MSLSPQWYSPVSRRKKRTQQRAFTLKSLVANKHCCSSAEAFYSCYQTSKVYFSVRQWLFSDTRQHHTAESNGSSLRDARTHTQLLGFTSPALETTQQWTLYWIKSSGSSCVGKLRNIFDSGEFICLFVFILGKTTFPLEMTQKQQNIIYLSFASDALWNIMY